MKHTITIIAFMITLSCSSQNQIVPLTQQNLSNFTEGIYLKDTQGLLTPYIGTWVWQNGNSSLNIVIEKLIMDYEATTTKQYRDKLVGRIKYIENGVLIFSTLTSEIPSLTQRNGIPINNNLTFSFEDTLTYHRFGGFVKISLINNGLQANFRLRDVEGPRFYLPGEQQDDVNFSIPKNTDFVLTKQ